MKIFISRANFKKLDGKIIFQVEGVNPQNGFPCVYFGIILDENLMDFKDQLKTGVISFSSSKYEISTFNGKTFIKFIPDNLKAEHPLKKNGSSFVYAKNIYVAKNGLLDGNKTYCYNVKESAFYDFMSKISIINDRLYLNPFIINKVTTDKLIISKETEINDDFLELYFFSK